jgi:uridylate kinase
MATQPAYKRVLLKLSGEMLAGERGFGIDPAQLRYVADEIKAAREGDVEIGLVVGGGNIHRGAIGTEIGLDRVTGDYMGMLGTVINALALQSVLENAGMKTRVLTALRITSVAEPFIRRRAIRHLEKGRIVIMAAGTGNPYFTTDTAAILRGVEIGVNVVLKGTKVDGVYDCDPMQNADAVKYDELSYDEAIRRDLRIMDSTAFAMCRENKIPIIVFRFGQAENLARVIRGEKIGTIVTN